MCYTAGMKFKSLQENLRKAIWERIDEGDLTGLRLAEQTGFKQAHISNFLNRKRSLSLEGMDRVRRSDGHVHAAEGLVRRTTKKKRRPHG